MEGIVFVIFKIFRNTQDLKFREYHSDIPQFGWGIFSHVRRLDQSRAWENMFGIIIADIR